MVADDLADTDGIGGCPVAQGLGVSRDGRQGSAQVVGDRHQELLIEGLRSFQLLGHPIDRAAEICHLVTTGCRHPDLEVTGGDRGGGLLDLFDGPHQAGGQEPGRKTAPHQHDHRRDEEPEPSLGADGDNTLTTHQRQRLSSGAGDVGYLTDPDHLAPTRSGALYGDGLAFMEPVELLGREGHQHLGPDDAARTADCGPVDLAHVSLGVDTDDAEIG